MAEKKQATPEGATGKQAAAQNDRTRPRQSREGNSATREGCPPGDQRKPTAAERAARQAEALRQAIIPACMAAALGLDRQVGPLGYRAYLDQLLKDAGDPTDPVERMLLEQLALAHFRNAQLHADAGQARGVEAAKIYNSLAARMLGELRRTALALRLYQARLPEGQDQKKLKIYKMAQGDAASGFQCPPRAAPPRGAEGKDSLVVKRTTD
jgi:hypothetical protein